MKKGKGSVASKRKDSNMVEELLEEAECQMMFENYDKALEMLTKLYNVYPENIEVVETIGTAYAELGMQEEAVNAFKKAIDIEPNQGHEKYMYLSQILEGDAGIKYANMGVTILRDRIEKERNAVEKKDLKAQAASAICGLVELMLNHDDADSIPSEAERLLLEAEQYDPNSPESSQVLASLLVEKGKPDEALAAFRRSMNAWYKPEKGGQVDAMDIDPPMLPSYEFRFEAAKLILELEEDASPAVDILEDLLNENDRNLDVWFLLTLAHQGSGEYEEALSCLKSAEALLKGYPPNSEEVENLNTLRNDVQESMRQSADEEQAKPAN